MGNAVKDTVSAHFIFLCCQPYSLVVKGRSWEALGFYRRAVDLNPNLPEAICGLVSSMGSVCDWRSRNSTDDEYGVDDSGRLIPPGSASEDFAVPCLMQRMISTCNSQLNAAYDQNVHCVPATKSLHDWLRTMDVAFGRPLTARESQHWHNLFERFYGNADRPRRKLNEGGFIIRFINWLLPRLQRRWYLKVYGSALASAEDLMVDSGLYSNLFLRPKLPRAMSPPVVPSILPFNTVSYRIPSPLPTLTLSPVHVLHGCTNESPNRA